MYCSYKARIRHYLTLIALCFLFIIQFSTSEAASGKMKVHFIDVGQGDAILVQSGSRNTLIDAGEESEYGKLTAYLNSKKITKIDQLIITHPDSDHMGAADFVLEQYHVKRIYMTQYANNTYEYKEMLSAITQNNVKRKNVKAGTKINLGACKATVLAADSNAGNSNDSSIVLRWKYGKKTFLMMGDASAKIENQLVASGPVKADVLKVGHHGSGYSSGIQFISKCSPQYAVICVGEGNSYGHPVKYTLQRLKRYAKYTLRTDLNGSILLTTDGKKITQKATKIQASETQEPTTTTALIGNKNTKVYHLPSCRSLPLEKNQITFTNKKEAASAGYRACKNCCP